MLPLKFSRMIIWGRRTEVVMLPERYLKDGMFTKMLHLLYMLYLSFFSHSRRDCHSWSKIILEK